MMPRVEAEEFLVRRAAASAERERALGTDLVVATGNEFILGDDRMPRIKAGEVLDLDPHRRGRGMDDDALADLEHRRGGEAETRRRHQSRENEAANDLHDDDLRVWVILLHNIDPDRRSMLRRHWPPNARRTTRLEAACRRHIA